RAPAYLAQFELGHALLAFERGEDRSEDLFRIAEAARALGDDRTPFVATVAAKMSAARWRPSSSRAHAWPEALSAQGELDAFAALARLHVQWHEEPAARDELFPRIEAALLH